VDMLFVESWAEWHTSAGNSDELSVSWMEGCDTEITCFSRQPVSLKVKISNPTDRVRSVALVPDAWQSGAQDAEPAVLFQETMLTAR